MLEDNMKVFLTGIGGIGMCGVAGILKNLGFEVYGSEKGEIYPPASEILKKLNIPVYKFDSQNIKKIKPDVLIVGNAIKKDHPEVVEAQKLHIPLYSFPSFLEKFVFPGKKVLVCAGTHGKTTTTALLSYLLEKLNLDPAYLIGGVLKDNFSNFKVGKSPWVVIEGDEYPSSFFDKSPKFLHYSPFALILTSLEYDHADVYPDLQSLKEVFKKLINLIPQEGIIVYNSDDPNLKDLISCTKSKARFISYGKNSEADFVLLSSSTSFKDGGFINRIKAKTPFEKNLEFVLSIPGEHNALNALSVLALIYGLGLLKEEVWEHFRTFSGVKRRQEVIYSNEDLVIIDDFAHHPTALKITLEELKKAIKPENTLLVFEPRTNSSKRKVFQQEYIENLALADIIFLKTPAGLENIPKNERIDLYEVAKSLKEKNKKVYFIDEKTDFSLHFSKKTLLVFMSSAYFKEEINKLKRLLGLCE